MDIWLEVLRGAVGGGVEEMRKLKKVVGEKLGGGAGRGRGGGKKGFLAKRGHVVKNWKTRWFDLGEGRLAYYRTPQV